MINKGDAQLDMLYLPTKKFIESFQKKMYSPPFFIIFALVFFTLPSGQFLNLDTSITHLCVAESRNRQVNRNVYNLFSD